MIVKHLEVVSDPFLPMPLAPKLRRILLDKNRKTVHIFKNNGDWIYHVPAAAKDRDVLLAGAFCVKRNNWRDA